MEVDCDLLTINCTALVWDVDLWCRAVRAHAACVRSLVPIHQTLVILCRWHRRHCDAVTETQTLRTDETISVNWSTVYTRTWTGRTYRDFLSFQQLLYHHSLTSRTKRLVLKRQEMNSFIQQVCIKFVTVKTWITLQKILFQINDFNVHAIFDQQMPLSNRVLNRNDFVNWETSKDALHSFSYTQTATVKTEWSATDLHDVQNCLARLSFIASDDNTLPSSQTAGFHHQSRKLRTEQTQKHTASYWAVQNCEVLEAS